MRLRFADCLFDSEARELWRRGEPVPVTPKVFLLLSLLLEHRPRPLSQQRLRDALWPEAHVGYTSLAQVVTELRKSLGDDARAPRLVRTVPRFGYAFSGEVAEEARFEPAALAGLLVAAEREYAVPLGETLVGRGPDCGVRLASSRVSRVHARLSADERGVSLADAGSKNGTWVNGQRRPAPAGARLEDGDEIIFGAFRVIFRSAGTNASTRTAGPAAAASKAGRTPAR